MKKFASIAVIMASLFVWSCANNKGKLMDKERDLYLKKRKGNCARRF